MKIITVSVLLAAVAAAGVQAHAHLSTAGDPVRAHMNAAIESDAVAALPEWAREVVLARVDAEYQVRAALIDLNADGIPEILLSAAPRTFDVHVPDRPLTVYASTGEEWRLVGQGPECRPQAVGAFRTGGWWDLRCREGAREHVLRWNGHRYEAV